MNVEPTLRVSDDTWDIADDLIVPEIDFEAEFPNKANPPSDSESKWPMGKGFQEAEMMTFEEPTKKVFAFKENKIREHERNANHQPPFAGKSEWRNICAELRKDLKVGNFVLKVVSKEVWWCESVYSIFGLQPKQIAPSLQLFSKLIHPMDKEVVFFLMDRAIKQAIPFEITHRIRLRDQSIKWCRFMCRVQYDARTRHVDKLVGTIQDITQWSNSVKLMAESSTKRESKKVDKKSNKKIIVEDEFQIQEDATCVIS
mmetsp:Transcript_7536/g.11407  ORF Transcript_7536/g.11407 Transcript_7536/m.11407 type:complete len:257 (-) Transcript_7536:302-1072(-)